MISSGVWMFDSVFITLTKERSFIHLSDNHMIPMVFK